MGDSLLSRFDCLFIMLDTIDVDRYRNPQEQDGQVLSIAADADVLTTRDLADNNDEEGETPIYEKYDALLHGNSRKKTDKIVSVQFMKKYIHIAKCMKPVLTEEASEMLADEYANLRANDFEGSGVARTQPVTARALETLIRLSTAHAKARLSKLVEAEDAELAIQLVQFAYFKKVLDKPGRKRSQDGSDSEEEEEEERSGDTPSKRKRSEDDSATPSKKKRVDPEAEAMLEVEATPSSVEVDQERYKQFMQLLHKCCAEKNQA